MGHYLARRSTGNIPAANFLRVLIPEFDHIQAFMDLSSQLLFSEIITEKNGSDRSSELEDRLIGGVL